MLNSFFRFDFSGAINFATQKNIVIYSPKHQDGYLSTNIIDSLAIIFYEHTNSELTDIFMNNENTCFEKWNNVAIHRMDFKYWQDYYQDFLGGSLPSNRNNLILCVGKNSRDSILLGAY